MLLSCHAPPPHPFALKKPTKITKNNKKSGWRLPHCSHICEAGGRQAHDRQRPAAAHKGPPTGRKLQVGWLGLYCVLIDYWLVVGLLAGCFVVVNWLFATTQVKQHWTSCHWRSPDWRNASNTTRCQLLDVVTLHSLCCLLTFCLPPPLALLAPTPINNRVQLHALGFMEGHEGTQSLRVKFFLTDDSQAGKTDQLER